MHILLVVADFSVESGGVTAVVRDIAIAVANLGHACEIATVDHGRTHADAAGVRVHRFPSSGAARLAGSAGLRRFLKSNVRGFDVVHIHGMWQNPGIDAARAARRANVPYIVAPHGMLDDWSLKKNYWFKSAMWAMRDGPACRHAAAIHCLNAAEVRRAPWLNGLRTVIVGNGVNAAEIDNVPKWTALRASRPEFAGNPGRPMVAFLSRLHPKKGLDRFLPFWPAVLAQVPEAVLFIAGTGDAGYEQSLRNLVTNLGVEQSVVFLGQVTGNAKWELLAAADAFVLPSHQEGFSMAATEAMAAGSPLVITEECNFDEVAGVGAGRVIPNGDMDAFTTATIDFLKDPVLRLKAGAAGREFVRANYTWDALAATMADVYQSIIDARAKAMGGNPR